MKDEETIRYRDAFPKDYDLPTYFTSKHAASMTLRDYFAARAMQALLSDSDWRHDMDIKDTALAAYKTADAMMKEREE